MDATAWCTPACMCSLICPTTKSVCQELHIWKKRWRTVLKIRFANLRVQGVSLVMLKHPLRVTYTVTVAYYREES